MRAGGAADGKATGRFAAGRHPGASRTAPHQKRELASEMANEIPTTIDQLPGELLGAILAWAIDPDADCKAIAAACALIT